MPRYFFTIHRQDQVENDPDGAYLPDAEAALSYAELHNPRAAKKERLYIQQRSGSDDDGQGSSRADGFVLAVFPWLLDCSLGC